MSTSFSDKKDLMKFSILSLQQNAEMVSAQFKFLKTSTFWGWFFIVIGSAFFLGFLFAAVISKLLPLSNNPLLSVIQNDR